jgi:hypothetical protein
MVQDRAGFFIVHSDYCKMGINLHTFGNSDGVIFTRQNFTRKNIENMVECSKSCIYAPSNPSKTNQLAYMVRSL